MHIVIFGAGSIGGYFGGRLANAGETVTFIARGVHLQAMQVDGLKVESINGDFSVKPVNATDDTTVVKSVDAVLVCVKTWQIARAAKAIIPMLGSNTFVVPLENGVEAPSQLAEILGREHVLAGLCRIASRIAAPGHIQHTAIDPSVVFGELDNRPSSRSRNLLQCFERAGVLVEIPPDINVAVWQKFLFISAVSGIGAVTRVPMGPFRSQPETHQMLKEALQECYSVALAQGIHLPDESVANTLAYVDTLPPHTMASMQRDIMDGRPSELEAQNGAIVRMGQMYNIPTPVHSFIYNSLLPQENLARGQ
ncbi:MAG: 2-dehydropantoate 2-reductase [Chloroflexi bacterium RBG_13_50_21]|nr:MAG: 2-dehydropantoate 2-reductase [Chloroflexi bacterium RBG_13_50_21]OGO66795.1 MAG: 2-dehydropantoate 2-reductase [Chloroflexi bacterium RBG_19FT_COMBO_50_10]